MGYQVFVGSLPSKLCAPIYQVTQGRDPPKKETTISYIQKNIKKIYKQ